MTSGPGSNAGVFQSQATLNLWTNPGAPNAYSPSTGGGVITPAGSGVSNFCFDVANGHIWVSNAATGVWSMLI